MAASIGSLTSIESIAAIILQIRGHRVMIDADLARLYGVTTKRLNEQIKRNRERFPSDFMFQLTDTEKSEVVANCDHLAKLKFSAQLPYAFTEHGVIMAANVLSSDKAVQTSVLVVRAFVRIRQYLATHQELAAKLDELQGRLESHDEQIVNIIDALRQLMSDPEPAPKPPIGFATEIQPPRLPRRRSKKS